MHCGDKIENLINAIYPDVNHPQPDDYFLDRTILAPRNDEVDTINEEIAKLFPGNARTYLSADSIAATEDNEDAHGYARVLELSQHYRPSTAQAPIEEGDAYHDLAQYFST